ncbi:unnamed protein product [Prorocentrum cordatum]|uniref:Uncharacterized protein n=1 Tax=Prorocentrum cordatum TaxID=2364126 RepID=A0ABN9Q5A8_9DINO|nr:unnamed protein product [Polarella glacialis]
MAKKLAQVQDSLVPAAGAKVATSDPTHIHNVLFGFRTSIKERFPGQEGQDLYDLCEQHYRMPDKKAPLFDARGNKLLHRHMEANPRQLGGAACVCAKRILEKGVMSRFRGPMIAIQAFYIAHDMQSQEAAPNKFVTKLIEAGISVQIWRSDTPHDVLSWLKHEGNEYHEGAPTIYLELLPAGGQRLNAIENIQAGWAAHCNSKGIGTATLPKTGPDRAEKQCEEFATLHFGNIFGSPWNKMVNAKAFYNDLVKLSPWSEYNEQTGKSVDFLRPGVSDATVANVNNIVSNFMEANYQPTIDHAMYSEAPWEVLKFCAPWTEDNANGPQVRDSWHFIGPAATNNFLNWPNSKMQGSTLYKPAAKANAKTKPMKAKKEKKEHDDKPAKRRKVGYCLPAEKMDLDVGDGSRQKQWLDDLVACISAPLAYLDAHLIMQEEVRKALGIGLKFAFLKVIALHGEETTGWKALRKELRNIAVKAHGNALRDVKLPGIADSKKASTTELTTAPISHLEKDQEDKDAIEQSLDEAIQHDPVLEAMSKSMPGIGLMQRMMEDQTFVKAMLAFLARNLSGHSANVAIMGACKDYCAAVHEKLDSLHIAQ